MLYFPMDFANLTIDGLIDRDALSNAISKDDFEQIETHESLKRRPPPDFQTIVANGQLETSIATL